MNLFELDWDRSKNHLPYEGTVLYFGKIFSKEQSDLYYQSLLENIDWRPDEAVIFGKRITTKRKVAWYADRAFEYTYSNITKLALPWTSELVELKKIVEQETGETYNSCLLNLYHDGNEGMAWHSDGEKDLKKDKTKIDLILEHGSLMVMKDTTQTHWLHRLPPTKKANTARINLTFRTIVG